MSVPSHPNGNSRGKGGKVALKTGEEIEEIKFTPGYKAGKPIFLHVFEDLR
jgi:hypothetical protein